MNTYHLAIYIYIYFFFYKNAVYLSKYCDCSVLKFFLNAPNKLANFKDKLNPYKTEHFFSPSFQNLTNGPKWTSDGVIDLAVHIQSTATGKNGALTEVATYNNSDGFHVFNNRLYLNLFHDFGNRTLTVVSWTVSSTKAKDLT